MKKLIKLIFIFLLSGCMKKDLCKKSLNFNTSKNSLNNVLVHGTLFPIMSHLTRTFDVPLGFHNATILSKYYGHGKAVNLLNQSNNTLFNLNNFYVFGWSGKLSFKARKEAAIELYNNLKNINGKINLIGHSHGGNVILLLEEVIQEKKDFDFKVDRLILLATPVQKATENYISSSIFKKVYLLYSTSDFIQVLDPQGLYYINNPIKVPFFSKRTFDFSPNLKQVQILLNNKSPGHLDFILNSTLLNSVSKILNILDKRDYKKIHKINIQKKCEPKKLARIKNS